MSGAGTDGVMAEHAIDKQLEGRLFDLLETRARIRLGDLVLLRRRSRERGVTLLHTALEAGRVEPEQARLLAELAGMPDPTVGDPDEEGRYGAPDDSLSDSLLDSVVDAPPETVTRRRRRSTEPRAEIPTLRAPAPLDRPARESLDLPPPASTSSPPAPPEPPPLRAPRWVDDRPTVKMDSPPSAPPAPRVIDRISAPRARPPSSPPPDPRPPTPRVVGELSPRRVTPRVPEAPPPLPAETERPPSPPPRRASPPPLPGADFRDTLTPEGERLSEIETVEPLDDEWGDTAPPSGTGPAESGDELELPIGADRYALGDELGRGGMGQILEARDLALDRPVALKLLHDEDHRDAALRLRFVDEARVTGQLQHPSIPPVYDLGRLGDGRLFFAMKRIEGRTLRDVVEELREGHGETVRHFGRVRLLTVFGRVCRAIAYAHSRAVMHRDLKPDNIMLGEFGEVTVMDWGLAKPFDADPATDHGADPGADRPSGERPAINTTRETSARFQTRSGEVTGTPQYMPPEQAEGRIDALGAHSDIYSLGAVLYELLTLEPPFDGVSARAVRTAVIEDQVVPPSLRAPEGREVPHAIEQLCLQCLSKDPHHRPKTAGEVADRIDRFLEGEQDRARRASERDRLLEAGTEAAEAYYAHGEQHKQLQAKTAKMRARMAPWAHSSERAQLWLQEDAERVARVQAAQSLSEAIVAYHAALETDRDHPDARRALAALYYNAFETAERDRDQVQMALYAHLVRAFDDEAGTFSTRLKGDGRLELQTLPAGIQARLYTYRSVERVQQPAEAKNLGQTPVVIDPMPMGSYLIELKGPGLTTRAPISITRQRVLRMRLRLFPDRIRGPGMVHVVGGPARLGGDPQAQLARPARTLDVEDVFIAERPVTAQAYREFLHHVAQTESPEAAAARAPRDGPGGQPLWQMDPMGRFTIPDRDVHGVGWHPDWPVVAISFADAEAYCRWLNEIRGPGHRLPTEVEWEKAARGADGRLFPWGDTWEPTFCHMGISRPGAPERGPSGAFATDVSPYGIEDLAGGVSEWTSTRLDGGEQRVIKGGHWASGPTECRAASRFTQPVDRTLPTLGFRVARSAPT